MAAAGAKIDSALRLADAPAAFGPRGFGHRHDRTQLIEEEAAAIRDAALRALGGEALSSIVEDWNRRGIRTTNDRPWRLNSLSALLIQPRLAGLCMGAQGDYVEAWPPIIDRVTHDRLVALRASRSRTRRPPRPSLLAGMLRCGRCGGHLHYSLRSERKQYYRCPSPAAGGCSGVSVPAASAEEFVCRLVAERLASREFLAGLRERSRAIQATNLQMVAADIRQDRAQLRELSRLWASREITRIEWQQARRSCLQRLERNEATLNGLASARVVLDAAGGELAAPGAWERLPTDRKHELFSVLLDHIVVEQVRTRGSAGRWTPASERMRAVWRGEALPTMPLAGRDLLPPS